MGMTEFWGTEVKPGQTVSCGFGNGSVIRISQVALGETKQKKEDVVVSVKVVDSKFVIGTLRAKSHPHMMCDLIFDKEFKLSHSSDTTSVFFCGYKAFESDAAEDEDKGKSNGDAPAKHGCKKDGDRDDEFHSSYDMDTYEDSISSTDNLIVPTYSDEEIPGDILFKDVSSSQTYEHETSKKASEIGLKLASAKENVELSCEKSGGKKGSHVATPYQSQQSSEKAMSSSQTYEHEGTTKKIGKKAAEIGLKLASVNENVVPSCQKSGGKTGSHVATPYQSQQSSKKRSANTKSGDKFCKSTGDHVCEPCRRPFVSDMALQAHRNAKHTSAE